MMKKIDLKCKIITPLFMGGAEQQPELRTQSFNGLFRYWFRLLGGSFEDEKRLFGWGGEEANKGKVSIVIKDRNISTSRFQRQSQGYNYLGFSLALTNREGIEKNGEFKLLLRFHPTSSNEDIKKFLCAVWCAFYLGNFGSRGRRGFGSIIVENINGDILHDFNLKFICNQNIGNWLKSQLEYIKSLNYWQARRDIPYIFENLEIYKFNRHQSNYIQLLNSIGEEYKNFRQKLRRNEWEKRIWFGLPIMPQGVFPILDHEERGRRASLLIFKIIKFNNNYEGFVLFFKPNERHDFKFLPDRAKIKFDKKEIFVDANWWQILDKFINDYLKNKNLITKVYP
ncbi:MAG: type III-B CRISPR module RAMP protein Cmr1 [candidate division WOR-3 bacterium]